MKGEVLLRARATGIRSVDFDFIQVKENGLGARDLEAHEAGTQLVLEPNLKRRRTADAAEVFFVLMTHGPLFAVVGKQNAQVVGIMQPGRVIQAIVNDDTGDRHRVAQ